MVVLHLADSSEIRHILWVDIAFVPHIDQFEEIDQIKVIVFGEILPQLLQSALFQNNFF